MNIQTNSPAAAGAPGALHPAIRKMLAGGTPSADTVERLLDGIETPLVQPGAATFLWRGEADRVEILRWIHAGVDRQPFTRMAGTDLWHLQIAVEDYGRFEYKLGVIRDGHEDWVLDPLNPARAGDPFGENSVCRTWGYQRPDWSEKKHDAPAGRIEEIDVESAVFGETRREQVYVSAAYRDGAPHPLVVIHDGADYMAYADLAASLDNLIAEGDIPPLVAVLVQAGDRMDEYPKGRRHARYVVNELLPAVAAKYTISDRPADRALLGASLGAVASLATAFRYPGVFGGLALKSGSFILDQDKLAQRAHPVFHRVARLVEAFRRAPGVPATRAFISTGELEGLADENRKLADFLRERGVEVLFKSAWDGHHWHNWRDQLRDALMWVLGPRDN